MAASEADVLLKLENLERLPEFLHKCVSSLSKENTSFDNTSGDTDWTRVELKCARTKIQNFFRRIAMDDNFSLPCDLPLNVKNALTNVYKIRQKDILNYLIKENLVNNGHNLVENIDWKLKWILGSSQLATMREPLCQIELRCASAEQTLPKKDVNFEVNLEKVDELISILRSVKHELSDL